MTTIADPENYSKVLDINKMILLESSEFRVLVPSLQKPGRYNLALNITGKNFSRVLHNYFDVFALSDSGIDTRCDQGTIRPFIFPSTIITLVVITLLVLLAIFLLILKRISEKRIARWKDRLSSDNRLN